MRFFRGTTLTPSLAATLAVLVAAATALAIDPVDVRVLEAAHLPTDPVKLLEILRRRIPLEAERAALDKLIGRFGSASFAQRERACAEVIALGTKAVYRLRPALTNPDAEVRSRAATCLQSIEQHARPAVDRAIIRTVEDNPPPGTFGVLIAFLPYAGDDSAADETLAALFVLAEKDRQGPPELVAALHDRQPERRGAAAFVLGRLEARRGEVRPLLADPDFSVRVRAAEGLLAGGDSSIVPRLLMWVDQGPAPLPESAEDLLAWLAGAETPATQAPVNEDTRRRCHEAWMQWWKDNATSARRPTADAELLVDLQALRARRVTQQFLNALIAGDDVLARSMMGTPFLYKYGRQNSVLEFGRVTRRLRAEYRALHAVDAVPKVAAVMGGSEYAARAMPSERDFLNGFPIRQVRIVTVSVPERGRAMERIFLVYLAEGHPRIIGYGSG